MTKNKTKPKYNAWQNFAWMVGIAWREKEKKILLIEGAALTFRVVNNLTELFVVPTILGAVEARVSIWQLLGTILTFVGLMILNAATNGYLNANGQFGKNTVRGAVSAMLNKKAATTSYPNLFDDGFSKLIARSLDAVNDSSVATVQVWKNMRELIQYTVVFLVHMLLITNIHPALFVVMTATSVCSYFLHRYFINRTMCLQSDFSEQSRRLQYIRNTAQDNTAAKDIRLFGLQSWFREMNQKVLTAYDALVSKEMRMFLYPSLAEVVLTFLQNGVAYAVLLHLVFSGKLSASEFLLYLTAVGGFAGYLNGIFDSLSRMNRHSISLTTVREALEYPEVFRFEDGKPLEPDKSMAYTIRLENVSYRYPNAEQDTLHNIDLTLHPGEKIAVVGLNGAGKTTLVHLICGFLDPTEGRVLLNGEDIRSFNRRDYYKLFSAVFQQFSVLPGTIAMNVAQSEDTIDMERVKDCIRLAGLQDKIDAEPAGYETLLEQKVYENAIMLSGGQIQRLMLARALYKDAPIVLLDEPTAALDPIAEADMYSRYHELTAGKASVYISHRLASTRFCDRILLIENGRIAEEGAHEALLKLGGRYAELFEIQRSYYAEREESNER